MVVELLLSLHASLTLAVWVTRILSQSFEQLIYYHYSMFLRKMGTKTRADIQKAYRERKSNRSGLPRSWRTHLVRFSEPTEKGRSWRTKKLFLRKRGIIRENRTSQVRFSQKLSRPRDGKQTEMCVNVHAFQGKVKEK